MAGPIDTAYVEILPDLKKFDKQATREIKAALDDAAREADKAAAKIEESITDSMRDAGRSVTRTVDGIQRQIREVDGTITIKMVVDDKEVIRTLRRDVNGKILNEKGKFASTGELLGLGLIGGITDGITKTATKSIGTSLSGALSAAGPYLVAAGVTMAVQLAGAIGPAIVALGASLPAAAGIGAAAIGTLTLGFQGLGDAIENAGDPEKFAEALKKLSPAARRFAIEIKNLMPIFRSIKDAAQEGIFKGLEGELTRVTKVLQGPLRVGFNDVGRSIRGFLSEMADLAVADSSVSTLNEIFATTARIIKDSTPSLQIFLGGIGDLVRKALPFVEKLSGLFIEFLERAGAGLSRLAADGSLDTFFSDALDTLKQVGRIGADVFKILATIFTAAGPSGHDLLDVLEDLAADMAEFLSHKEVVESLAVAFKMLGAVLSLNLRILGATREVGTAIGTALGEVIKWAKGAASAVGDFGKATGKWFVKAWDATQEFFVGIGHWFSELPGKIGDFLSSIPGKVADAFTAALAAALRALGLGIGVIIFTVTELPGQIIGALFALPGLLGTFFSDLWSSVSTWTANAWTTVILPFIYSIPERIAVGIASLRERLYTFFSQLWADVRTWAVNGWNSIIAWINGVPERIASMGVRFYNSGLALIKGFFNGLVNGASSGASSVGNAIFGAFKSGLNWAIRQINAGIAQVDDSLPGSLPRIPQLAKGGLALGPSMIGEAGKEIALPLQGQRGKKALELLAAAANGGGSAITFGPGSVAVSFEGVVPSEQEARMTGEAAGRGILGVLAQRNARMQIRTA